MGSKEAHFPRGRLRQRETRLEKKAAVTYIRRSLHYCRCPEHMNENQGQQVNMHQVG